MEIKYSSATLKFDLALDLENTFRVEPHYATDVPVRVDFIEVRANLLDGRINLDASGLGIKSNGEVGKQSRNVYVLRWEDLPQAVRDIINDHVESTKASIA